MTRSVWWCSTLWPAEGSEVSKESKYCRDKRDRFAEWRVSCLEVFTAMLHVVDVWEQGSIMTFSISPKKRKIKILPTSRNFNFRLVKLFVRLWMDNGSYQLYRKRKLLSSAFPRNDRMFSSGSARFLNKDESVHCLDLKKMTADIKNKSGNWKKVNVPNSQCTGCSISAGDMWRMMQQTSTPALLYRLHEKRPRGFWVFKIFGYFNGNLIHIHHLMLKEKTSLTWFS